MFVASGVVGIGVIWIGYRNRNHMVRMASRAAAPLMIPVLARFLTDMGRLDVRCRTLGFVGLRLRCDRVPVRRCAKGEVNR